MEKEIFTLDKILGALTIMFISPIFVSGIISALVTFWSKSRAEVKLEKEKASFLETVQRRIEKEKGEIHREVQEHLEKIKKEHQKEIDYYRAEIEKSKAKSFRYSEHQFKLYNDLWLSLYDLKIKADRLWEKASANNLTLFASQLHKTNEMIEKSILLLEDEHYEELKILLERFSNFHIGKERLINLRRQNNRDNYISDYEIENVIQNNQAIVTEYTQIISEIGRVLKRQIKD